ncbi:hypothetical protein HYH02_010185 [Chlamydomonas schloesseri]|uniref:Uncharacterized protein n=1 Tax=Chlamydomonas schloesseri TaxID=2026947 RepID=A0A835W905_9CHLO|nr:hypothetical protein HYH02_010185 [Chlamydomonas schloesseri]|eukprot:KAG2440606.1 hypothetical protein HYH02_010185 [Chlamydomonas schloesseri]
MGWEFTDHHVRPNVFYWAPKAYKEREEVKTRRDAAQAAYEKAKKATADGRHAEAEQLLLHSVTAWPDNPRFSHALANCIFLDRGRPADAMQWYDETLRLKDSPEHRAGRSRARAALGRLVEGLEDAAAAVEGEPENPDYLVLRAMLLERLGRYKEAIDDYGAALPHLKAAGVPTFECLFNRGYCHKMLGRTEDAISELEAAALQNTTSMTVRTVLGALYLSKRRYARAADVFAVVAQQQYGSASAASNAALASYFAVTADYDDSSPATRAASLNEQRQRAARAAALASAHKPLAIAPPSGDSVANTPRDVEGDPAAGGAAMGTTGRRSLAKQVTKHREAAAAAAAAAAAGGGGGGPGNLSARSLRARAVPSVAALLDEQVAADEGALGSPRSGRGGAAAAAAAGGGAGTSGGTGAGEGDSSDDELGGGGGGGGGEHGGGGGGGPGGNEPPPTVYLAADPRQWAADVIRENESQAVWDADKKLALEQALKGFDIAMANQRALAKERAAAEAEAAAAAAGRPVERPGRHVLDSDTTAVEVGEAGDIPGGLLLLVDRRHRTPGTAVVHDREIEEGEMQYNRGLVLLALGRLAEAAADLDAALAANPHHAHYPYYQAVVCARRGRDDEAIAWDNLALQRNPAYFHALYHLGLVLHLRGEHTEAIQRLDAAAGLQPRDWRVMEARGRVLQNLDRHNEAVPALRDALAAVAADGDQPPAVSARLHFALAQSAVAAHQPNLLRESLRLARLHGQDPASVANLRGCLARKERQFDVALRHLSRAVAASPGDARFYYDRAQCHLDMGSYPEAIDDLTTALEAMPDSALLLFSRGGAQLSFEAGDVRAAAEDLQRAADICKGTLRGEGPLWESRKFMSSGSGAPDLSPSLWYQLGCAYARCGAAQEALAAFRRAAGLMPGHPVFIHELAKACQVAGDAAGALTHFNAVLKLQPRNARALLRRGLALKCLKRYDEAAEDLLAARRLDPTNPLMQLDMRSLGSVSYIELCSPGDEDDAYVMIKY